MPGGSKTKYSAKQKRMARHIEAGYETRGVSEDEAERRAWATVNADTGGGERGGSGSRGGARRKKGAKRKTSAARSSSSRSSTVSRPAKRRGATGRTAAADLNPLNNR